MFVNSGADTTNRHAGPCDSKLVLGSKGLFSFKKTKNSSEVLFGWLGGACGGLLPIGVRLVGLENETHIT